MSSNRSRASTLTRALQAAGALVVLTLLVLSVYSTLAAQPGNEHFQRTWQRTDQPILDGLVLRTWMWGPQANSDLLSEPYAESPNGSRQVQYYDKARMEITSPDGDASSVWYVTNGLLVVELITGQLQTGDATFEQRAPAPVNVAGDFDDPTGPSYQTFSTLLDAAPLATGAIITQRLDRQGTVSDDPALAGQGVTAALIDEVTTHTIAAPFWDFMTSSGTVYEDGQLITDALFENPYFATGRPVTEAYWANVKVAGSYRDVLMQCFERRCLTYTPGNPEGFVVEAGNVGQHYHTWRYGQGSGESTATPTATATETATATATTTEMPVTEYEFATQWGKQYTPFTRFDNSLGVVVDGNDHLWVIDEGNNRVVEFDEQGVFVRSLGRPGTGPGEFSSPGDIAFSEDGRIYVVEGYNYRVQVFGADGAYLNSWGAHGSADGYFDIPDAIEIRDDTVYVTDTYNSRIQMFTLNGVYLGQFGSKGSNTGQFDLPGGLAFDAQGNLYVADRANHRIQVFTSSGTYLSQVGEKGTGDGQFDFPGDIAFDAAGNFYVSDAFNSRIQMFGPDGTFLMKWGTQGQGLGEILYPTAIEADDRGDIYVADPSNDRIQKFTAEGRFLYELYDGSRGQFGSLLDITLDQNGNLLTLDTNKRLYEPGSISRFTTDGVPLDVLSWTRPEIGQYDQLAGVAVNLETGDIYVTDRIANRVQRFTSTWQYRGSWGTPGSVPGQFNGPTAIAIDADGNVYVADAGNNRIQKFDANGVFLDQWGGVGDGNGQFQQPGGITVAGERVYVSDYGNDRVQVFDRQGIYLEQWGTTGSEPGQLKGPAGIALNPDGNVLVVDVGNNRVQLFTPDGDVLGSVGTAGSGPGQFNLPFGLTVDADGNVYVTDILNYRVQKFSPAG